MRRLAALAAFAAVWIGAGRAGAYCQSSLCKMTLPAECSPGVYEVCAPADSCDCGAPILWAQPCVSFDVQKDASNQIDWGTADGLLQQAFNTWLSVDCGDGPPSIQVLDLGAVACDEVEFNDTGYEGNANILVFRDRAWPHTGGMSVGTDTLALTTVTYSVDTGEILNADIEVNTAENTFTTNDMPTPGEVDLLSVLTHETGHFLGLAHSRVDIPATMAPIYPGGISMRTLSEDDMAAICATYPPTRASNGDESCLPRHGWAADCGPKQDFGSCALARGPVRTPPRRDPGGGAPDGSFASVLAIVAALGVRRVRARSGSRGS